MTVRLPAGAVVEVSRATFGLEKGEPEIYVYQVKRRKVRFISDLTLVELVPVNK
jgi:hypothetical protein